MAAPVPWCWQVGSVEEARTAADVGCDLLAVQGCRRVARPWTDGLLPLLTQVLDVVEAPVPAAGGIH